jgi:hypothetical protein
MKMINLSGLKQWISSMLVVPVMCVMATPTLTVAQDEGGPLKVKPESSPFLARQDARKISAKFRDRGFTIMPVATGNNKYGELVFRIELIKGLDYVIMVGIDGVIQDVDLYVKDEVGNMIAQDTRTINRACVQFAASYNGIYEVVVDPAKTRLLGHFAVLAGVQAAN